MPGPVSPCAISVCVFRANVGADRTVAQMKCSRWFHQPRAGARFTHGDDARAAQAVAGRRATHAPTDSPEMRRVALGFDEPAPAA